MVSSSRLIVAAVLLIFSVAVSSSSQTTPEKGATASISGKVKIKDKAVAGVIVFAEEQNSPRWLNTSYRDTTDQNGNYRITGVRAGTYTISPVAPSFALEDYVANNEVVISEGETVEDINFSMIPGGVITGKISDPDGKPLVEEYVNVMPVDPASYVRMRFEGNLHTDDRGIYRAFGLHPGRYKVSVGQSESLPGKRASYHRQTFYPSVTDDAKATVIEVTEGSETTNIDIVVGRAITTFKVNGRVTDADTGKPLGHIKFGVYQSRGDSGGSSRVGQDYTNANGEFRLDNVLPGKYAVFIVPEDSGVRGDQVSFEVVDRDVTDLVIRAGKAASVAGVVTFEAGEEQKPGFKFDDLYINGWVDGGVERHFSGGHSQRVQSDGSFKLGDLRKGRVRFFFALPTRSDHKQVQLVRVERDGVVQPGGLILKDGEQVTGVRLVARFLTGAIHGQITLEGDESPGSRISVWITYLDDKTQGESFSMGNSSPQLDSRKRFKIEGLPAGTYEVNVAVFDPNRQDTNRVFKQQVTVVDNVASDVTITIKAKP